MLKNSGFVIHKLDPSAGQKDSFAEVLEAVEAKGYPLQYLYLVVEALADTVGLPVFSAVLHVSAPVPDGAGGGADLLHLGGGVFMDPFGKIFVLYRIREGKDDVMEELQGFIGLIKLRRDKKGFQKTLLILFVPVSPVDGLVDFLGF